MARKDGSKLMTVGEVAQVLGVIDRRVRQIIEDETLPAEKVGRDWIIRKRDLDGYMAKRQKVGDYWVLRK